VIYARDHGVCAQCGASRRTWENELLEVVKGLPLPMDYYAKWFVQEQPRILDWLRRVRAAGLGKVKLNTYLDTACTPPGPDRYRLAEPFVCSPEWQELMGPPVEWTFRAIEGLGGLPQCFRDEWGFTHSVWEHQRWWLGIAEWPWEYHHVEPLHLHGPEAHHPDRCITLCHLCHTMAHTR